MHCTPLSEYLFIYLLCNSQGFLEQGVLVTDTKRLEQRCLTMRSFHILFLAPLLPTDALSFALASHAPWPFLRANRLLKFSRVLELRVKIETSTNHPYQFRILSIGLIIFLIIHWNACAFFLISQHTSYFGYLKIDHFTDTPEMGNCYLKKINYQLHYQLYEFLP
jgi:hypothetical protein